MDVLVKEWEGGIQGCIIPGSSRALLPENHWQSQKTGMLIEKGSGERG